MDPKTLPKVLYVDDTPEARLLVRRMLSRNYIVLEAKDAISGIELAIDTHPDLILLDINLPEMSGREVATRLRTLFPDTPLVALTADNSPEARERALAAGCSGFITKPISIDTFENEVFAYLHGKLDQLPDSARHIQRYQAEVVEHLEAKVRELTKTAERNAFLNEQNQQMIAELTRRQRLLEGAARVGQSITSILDLEALLTDTVDIICDEYEFYYAGIFLIDEIQEWAVLKAGHGEAGLAMIAEGFRLPIDDRSMIGRAILHSRAQISLDVNQEQGRYQNPHLLRTRSEMTLPLIFKENVLGALSVQSEQLNAFSEADITALQTLADQVAVAIQNARLLQDLEQANHELLRQKTFEAIATATGEAIHWVGNKAAPILPSAERVRLDILDLAAIAQELLEIPPERRADHPLWPVLQASLEAARNTGLNLVERAGELGRLPPRQLQVLGGLESILEDLEIITQSAETILRIKEDLIGPVRLAHPQTLNLAGFLSELIVGLALPAGVVHTDFAANLPPAWGDPRQMANVFNNLIKNAWEALEGCNNPRIWVSARRASERGFVQVQIKDNGPGIPPELIDKIWVSFFTTKADRGGTGLGLFSCMEIIRQAGGKIWVTSQVGRGTTFFVQIPIAEEQSTG
jgi:signal transduction histidine kinase/DNA-binding NarL/FixJ family response regulator